MLDRNKKTRRQLRTGDAIGEDPNERKTKTTEVVLGVETLHRNVLEDVLSLYSPQPCVPPGGVKVLRRAISATTKS